MLAEKRVFHAFTQPSPDDVRRNYARSVGRVASAARSGLFYHVSARHTHAEIRDAISEDNGPIPYRSGATAADVTVAEVAAASNGV
jgi:hypothetical protein